MFSRKLKILTVAVATVSLLTANLGVASAHQWWRYHWDKSGPSIVIQNWIYGDNQTEAEYAREDGWNTIGILYNYSVPYHTDISVYGGNYGATGWWGLATLENVDFDFWGCFCYDHISHAHAAFNTYYGGTTGWMGDVQGVFCQEIAHGWGLDHSPTADCMAKGYYSPSSNGYSAHTNQDFWDMYRFH
jgi:hypothetical protein